MAQALLCDLGGVLIDFSFSSAIAEWSRVARVPAESIAERFVIDREWADFEVNQLTERQYLAHLRRQCGITLTDQELVRGWNAVYEGVNREVEQLLLGVRRRGHRMVAVTNTNVIHQRVWRDRYARQLRVFHSVYSSCEIGCRKPEPAFFQQVASSEGIALDEAVFVDDTEENVVGARNAGLSAFLYTDSDRMRVELHRRGLIGDSR